jgi:hypothetical protein
LKKRVSKLEEYEAIRVANKEIKLNSEQLDALQYLYVNSVWVEVQDPLATNSWMMAGHPSKLIWQRWKKLRAH